MKQKSNKQFMILSAIGIIMVVDAHSWTTLNLLTALLPYNSFFMPMLVFVSGYFYDYHYDEPCSLYGNAELGNGLAELFRCDSGFGCAVH